jgi:hypothetical protein
MISLRGLIDRSGAFPAYRVGILKEKGSGLVSATTIVPATTGCWLQALGPAWPCLDSIVLDATLLKKGFHPYTRPESEELTDLFPRQPTVPVGASRRLIPERTSRIAAGRHELPDKLVGNFDGHLHSLSVAKWQKTTIDLRLWIR